MNRILFVLLLITSFTAYSQNDQNVSTDEGSGKQTVVYKREISKNELSIGALNLVAFGALDIAYERIINSNTSWSVETFFLALNRDNEDIAEAYLKDFSVTGKVKYFFSERTAWGFYVNGLAMISSGEIEQDFFAPDTEINSETDTYTDLALGFGLGGKFVATQGFFVDLNAGIGRNLLSSDSPTIIGQFGVNLGYRF